MENNKIKHLYEVLESDIFRAMRKNCPSTTPFCTPACVGRSYASLYGFAESAESPEHDADIVGTLAAIMERCPWRERDRYCLPCLKHSEEHKGKARREICAEMLAQNLLDHTISYEEYEACVTMLCNYILAPEREDTLDFTETDLEYWFKTGDIPEEWKAMLKEGLL